MEVSGQLHTPESLQYPLDRRLNVLTENGYGFMKVIKLFDASLSNYTVKFYNKPYIILICQTVTATFRYGVTLLCVTCFVTIPLQKKKKNTAIRSNAMRAYTS
jgi:hypothetical protein